MTWVDVLVARIRRIADDSGADVDELYIADMVPFFEMADRLEAVLEKLRARGFAYEGMTAEKRRRPVPEWVRRIPIEVRLEVFQRDGYRCLECGRTSRDVELQLDHVVPRSRGGTDGIENIQTLCAECNVRKSDRLPGED